MRARSVTALITVVVSPILAASTALSPAAASAQMGHRRAEVGRNFSVGCSGSGCDFQSPVSTGCSRDAYTVGRTYIDGGYVDLRWSPTCQTNWARTTSTSGVIKYPSRLMSAHIIRQDNMSQDSDEWVYNDGLVATDQPGRTPSSQEFHRRPFKHITQLYTDMLYAPQIPTAACGQILFGRSQGGCFAQFPLP